MMMTLGLFVFMLERCLIRSCSCSAAGGFASNNRVGFRPSLQFAGPDNDTLTLSSVLLPS